MKELRQMARRLWSDDRGMETVEWAILAALITAGIVTAISTLAGNVHAGFQNLANNTAPH